MECIFCRIIAGELPGSVVCRGNSVVAFMDIQPVNFGHVLVVPVAHAGLIGEVETEVAVEMSTMVSISPLVAGRMVLPQVAAVS